MILKMLKKILDLFEPIEKKNIYAVYEDDLDDLLVSTGIKDNIESGVEVCFVCGNKMDYDGL
ncbi:hypothetical protein IID26_00430, partial [Patescibacteria group bacterium]|nr:hypothetical protein [Patescibacteria group bacterium]